MLLNINVSLLQTEYVYNFVKCVFILYTKWIICFLFVNLRIWLYIIFTVMPKVKSDWVCAVGLNLMSPFL
jgi:hypothetical protein